MCACGVLKFGRIYGFKAYNFLKEKFCEEEKKN